MNKKTVAVIHARGGSKRIPKKNIKKFHGKEIIAYPIIECLNSKKFIDTVVSTDCEEIATVAKKYGASVHYVRPQNISDDYATTADVLRFDINEISKIHDFDYICCVYATSPFLKSSMLVDAIENINIETYSIVPMCEYDFPIQRAFKIENQGNIAYRQPKYQKVRSQDLEKFYHDVGMFYVVNKKLFLENKNNEIIGNSTKPLIISSQASQDIDTPEDWEIASLKYKMLFPDVKD